MAGVLVRWYAGTLLSLAAYKGLKRHVLRARVPVVPRALAHSLTLLTDEKHRLTLSTFTTYQIRREADTGKLA